MKIIINADDFGINEVVTSEIERMILAGVISSTTVMANGSCLDEVKRFATTHPEASYGIHLCLSEFESITKSDMLHQVGLTDEKGQFLHKAIFGIKGLDNQTIRNAIRDELNAQIDVITALGFPISHADSHHHVHTIYSLRELFADVLQKRGISKIRIGNGFYNWRSRRHIILWLQRIMLNKYYKSQFVTTDAFYSYERFVNNCEQSGEQVVELMCHPGHPSKHFFTEMELVISKAALKKANIKLISYNDLH